MKKANFYVKVVSISLLALSFAACQAGKKEKSSETKTETHSYSFNDNGCETGKKEFATLAEYCASLADDVANNTCAREQRSELYNEKCGGVKPQEQNPEGSATTETPPAPQEQAGDTQPAPAAPSAPADPAAPAAPATQTAQQNPEEIVLKAHPETKLEVKPFADATQMITMLTGKLIVDSAEPAITKQLMLSGAESITINTDMGKCELSEKSFNVASDNKSMEIRLSGSDPAKAPTGDGCLARLSTLTMLSFTIEFKNVPAGTLNQTLIPKVTLEIEDK